MPYFGSIFRISGRNKAARGRLCTLSGMARFGSPGEHTEALLVGMLAEQRLGTRRIAVADRFNDGVVAAMRPKQHVERA